MDNYKEKLKALCEGLELNNITLLLESGQVGDYRRVGEKITKITKDIFDTKNAEIEKLENQLKYKKSNM